MTTPETNPSREDRSDTEYYDLKSSKKNGFAGDRTLVIWNEDGTPFFSLRPVRKEGEPAVPPPPHNEGHIVIADISRTGYEEILSFAGNLGTNLTMKGLKQALCESGLFTKVESQFNPNNTGWTNKLYADTEGKIPVTGFPLSARELLDRMRRG